MINKPLKLSIVIPAYNEQNHIKKCLQAISAQTEPADEVIVVDNNSKDDTRKIVAEFPFVKVLKEKKQGVTYARNSGFNAATGDIIGRIDADTRIDSDWAAKVRKIFADKKVAAATGPAYYYDMPLKEKNYIAEHAFKNILYKYAREFPFLLGANMAIRRSEWESIRRETCVAKEIHEDMDLAIHLYLNNRHIVYDSKMRAGASSRRFDSGPGAFYKYSLMMTSSFNRHDMNPMGAKVAITAYSFGYMLTSPLRRAYDDVSEKRSIRHLLKRSNVPRENPNH